jgi:hypothetical protein
MGIIRIAKRFGSPEPLSFMSEGVLNIATYDVKRKCVELSNSGMSYREIYSKYFNDGSMTFRSFSRRMAEWKEKIKADNETLETANLAYKFSPYASTVQVNGKGQMVQAWIKQSTEDRIEEILEAIKNYIPPVKVEPAPYVPSESMLEIPLFDMHFGIADIEFYSGILKQILSIITSRRWDKIVIPVGQDLFHNDSIANGITTKGTQIEKVDLYKAVADAEVFYFNIIDAAILKSNSVDVIYSPGNHDKTVGWMFSRILKQRYGDIVDDTVKERKAILWRDCFVGFTHGEKRNDTASDLRGKFTMEYPVQFAVSKIKEIHAGHLHREGERDEYGVQIRRVACGNKSDSWTEEQGFKSIKRFMLFEWAPGRLKAIHYIE